MINTLRRRKITLKARHHVTDMGKAKKESLIIVGAGATGLMAAYQLADTFNITILEASAETGGRIRTIEGMEAGAEFVHGDLPLTMELLKKQAPRLKKQAGIFTRSPIATGAGRTILSKAGIHCWIR
jgi:monoamine oxidase